MANDKRQVGNTHKQTHTHTHSHTFTSNFGRKLWSVSLFDNKSCVLRSLGLSDEHEKKVLKICKFASNTPQYCEDQNKTKY